MNRDPGLLHQNFGNFKMFYRSTVQGYKSQVFWMNFNPSSAGYTWLRGHLAILGTFRKQLWALKSKSSYIFSPLQKIHIFQCMSEILLWNFKGTLRNSTQNMLPIHWRIWFLHNIEILRALWFKSSYAFLKLPLDQWIPHHLMSWFICKKNVYNTTLHMTSIMFLNSRDYFE